MYTMVKVYSNPKYSFMLVLQVNRFA